MTHLARDEQRRLRNVGLRDASNWWTSEFISTEERLIGDFPIGESPSVLVVVMEVFISKWQISIQTVTNQPQ